MADVVKDTIIRNMIADYLNVGTPEAPEFAFMGRGFNTLDENPNAQTEQKAYISDKSQSSTITSYQVQFPYDTDLIASQEAIMALYDVGRNQKQAGEAEKEYVRVDVFKGGSANSYPARKFLVAVEVSGITGAGAEIIHVAGNLNGVGDFVEGTFDLTTKTFTATP